MSKAVSALNGAVKEGYVAVADAGAQGMITLRGDLASAPVKKALKAAGLAVPGVMKVSEGKDRLAMWMSPDELMILCDYSEAGEIAAAMEKALGKTHSQVVVVSDARAMLRLTGDARQVLAKLSPADTAAMQVGDVRRSRLAQIPAAFWLTGEAEAHVICFRSVAKYAFDILSNAAMPGAELH